MSAPLPHGFLGARPLTTRERLELEIERLIALLDVLDDDPDIEPAADDEPNDDDLDEPFNPLTLNPRQQVEPRRSRRSGVSRG